MATCEKHGDYHEDHGCGVAVGCGSSYADHCIRCDLSPMYTPISPWMAFTFGPKNPKRKWKQPREEGYIYPPWEAPAGNCPVCWHEVNP